MRKYRFEIHTTGIIEAKHDAEAEEFLEAVQHYDDSDAEKVETSIKVEPIEE